MKDDRLVTDVGLVTRCDAATTLVAVLFGVVDVIRDEVDVCERPT